jgi:hypothetical protein
MDLLELWNLMSRVHRTIEEVQERRRAEVEYESSVLVNDMIWEFRPPYEADPPEPQVDASALLEELHQREEILPGSLDHLLEAGEEAEPDSTLGAGPSGDGLFDPLLGAFAPNEFDPRGRDVHLDDIVGPSTTQPTELYETRDPFGSTVPGMGLMPPGFGPSM